MFTCKSNVCSVLCRLSVLHKADYIKPKRTSECFVGMQGMQSHSSMAALGLNTEAPPIRSVCPGCRQGQERTAA